MSQRSVSTCPRLQQRGTRQLTWIKEEDEEQEEEKYQEEFEELRRRRRKRRRKRRRRRRKKKKKIYTINILTNFFESVYCLLVFFYVSPLPFLFLLFLPKFSLLLLVKGWGGEDFITPAVLT